MTKTEKREARSRTRSKAQIDATAVVAFLKKRYAPPGYAFMEQVADGTGANHTRWADAVAMSVWPSRGLSIHGFEVKVSRYDLLNELRNPAKADAVMGYCDYWWLVLGDADLIQPGELPETWGQLSVHGGAMRCDKAAPKLNPKPVDLQFVASVLRNYKRADAEAVVAAYNEGRADGYKEGAEQARQRTNGGLADRFDELRKAVDDFERASGIRIATWNGGKLGEAVAVIRNLRDDSYLGVLAKLESAVAGLKQLRDTSAQLMALAAENEALP